MTIYDGWHNESHHLIKHFRNIKKLKFNLRYERKRISSVSILLRIWELTRKENVIRIEWNQIWNFFCTQISAFIRNKSKSSSIFTPRRYFFFQILHLPFDVEILWCSVAMFCFPIPHRRASYRFFILFAWFVPFKVINL